MQCQRRLAPPARGAAVARPQLDPRRRRRRRRRRLPAQDRWVGGWWLVVDSWQLARVVAIHHFSPALATTCTQPRRLGWVGGRLGGVGWVGRQWLALRLAMHPADDDHNDHVGAKRGEACGGGVAGRVCSASDGGGRPSPLCLLHAHPAASSRYALSPPPRPPPQSPRCPPVAALRGMRLGFTISRRCMYGNATKPAGTPLCPVLLPGPTAQVPRGLRSSVSAR